MKDLDVQQGTPAWLAARSSYFCASEAAPMMGASKHTTRTELLRMKATGDVKEFSNWAQSNLIDKGHAAEYKAREFAEELIGQELYPVTATDDAGVYLASCDGLTMDETIVWENKLWNDELAKAVRAGDLPASHYWQLEHILLVTGAGHVLFTVTDGTKERFAHMEYRAVPGRAQQLIAGWRQFAEDVANYQHVESAPKPIAKIVRALPALVIQIDGKVTSSNLTVFKNDALTYIESINTDLKTDEDFVNAEADVKACEAAEERLDLVKAQAQAQAADIDAVFRTIDQIRETFRQKRLDLTKRVTSKKQDIRNDIRAAGEASYSDHIRALNVRLGKPYMPPLPVDFASAMSGKKTVASLQDAVNTALANAKIAASAVADKIQVNLNTLREKAKDHAFLFHDAKDIVLKAPEDLTTLVSLRIREHDEAETKKRQEEAAKLAAQQPAPAPQPAAQPAPATAPVLQGSQAEQLELARQELELFLKNFGHIKALTSVTAPMRAYLNAGGKRKAAA